MGDFPNIIAANYGTSAFSVESCELTEEPIMKKDQGRVGIRLACKVNGYISADTPADLTTRLAAAYADLLVAGRDFTVTGINGAPLLTILAADCLDGGPYVKYRMTQSSPLTQDFEFVVLADQPPPDNHSPTDPSNKYKVDTKVRPDGLTIVTWTGEIAGQNTPAYFFNTIVPAGINAFPSPNWVTEWSYSNSTDANQSHLQYTFTATQMAAPLPRPPGAVSVQGEETIRTEVDEQLRKTVVYEYDLLLYPDGDWGSAVKTLRGNAEAALGLTVYRETATVTQVREIRLKATFSFLTTGGDNPLIAWEQSIESEGSEQTYEIKRYIGADPVAVEQPSNVNILVQSGSATAVAKFVRAPSPRYLTLVEPPKITYRNTGDETTYRTTWAYRMYVSGANGTPAGAFVSFGARPPLQFIDRKGGDLSFFSST